MSCDWPSNPAASLLEETLDSVVPPAARDAMLEAALQESGHSEVPSEPEEFRQFVLGPLRRALTRGLGEALALTVIEELEITCRSKPPTLRPGAAGARNASDSSRMSPGNLPRVPRAPLAPLVRRGGVQERSGARFVPSSSASAPPVSGPVLQRPRPGAVVSAEFPALAPVGTGATAVIAVTRDRRTAGSLDAWLGDRVPVIVVSDLLGLVHAVDASGHAVLIVIDCYDPSVRPVAVAALEGELTQRAHFVLWGATADDDRALAAVSSATRAWTRCAGPAPADLAALCADLVS